MAINIVIQQGRLARDIEVKVFKEGGTPTAYLTIVQQIYNGKEKVANYFNWIVYGKTADNMAKYCKKGDMVILEGNETTSSKEDNQGNKVEATRRTVMKFELINSPKDKSTEDDGEDDTIKQNKAVNKAINGGREAQNDEFYNTSKHLVTDEDLPF